MEGILKQYLIKKSYSSFDLKAVLFDMDGVLYDSMKWHALSWKEAMDYFNIQSTTDEFYLYEGMVGHKTIDHLMKREKGRNATEAEKEEIYKYKTKLFTAYNDGSLIPCAYDFVNRINAAGLKCVLVTGSGQPTLIEKLDSNFHGLFKKELMVTAFDVKHGKPHPEPFLMGLSKAGNLNPNQAIVVENAPRGVEAAVAANIFTIAVNTGPLSDDILWDAGANMVFGSMEKLYNEWNKLYQAIQNVTN